MQNTNLLSYFTPTNILIVEGILMLFLFIWIYISKKGYKKAKQAKKEGVKRGKIRCISIDEEKFEYENIDGLKGTLLMNEQLLDKFKNIKKDSEFDFSYMILPGGKRISIVFNDDENLDLDFEFISTKLIRATKHSLENAIFFTFLIFIILMIIDYFCGILPTFMMEVINKIFIDFKK